MRMARAHKEEKGGSVWGRCQVEEQGEGFERPASAEHGRGGRWSSGARAGEYGRRRWRNCESFDLIK
jgi:hypothetical protein